MHKYIYMYYVLSYFVLCYVCYIALYITSYDATSYYMMSYRISYNSIWCCHILWHNISSFDITSYQYRISVMPYHTKPYHITFTLTSHHITVSYIISHHTTFTSHHIAPHYHIISYHIMLCCVVCCVMLCYVMLRYVMSKAWFLGILEWAFAVDNKTMHVAQALLMFGTGRLYPIFQHHWSNDTGAMTLGQIHGYTCADEVRNIGIHIRWTC